MFKIRVLPTALYRFKKKLLLGYLPKLIDILKQLTHYCKKTEVFFVTNVLQDYINK